MEDFFFVKQAKRRGEERGPLRGHPIRHRNFSLKGAVGLGLARRGVSKRLLASRGT